MNIIRMNQINEALNWAENNRNRTVYIKVESGAPASITIIELRGNEHYCVSVKEDSGTDFSALLDAKEREKDEKELARLQEKLGVKNEISD